MEEEMLSEARLLLGSESLIDCGELDTPEYQPRDHETLLVFQKDISKWKKHIGQNK